MNQVLCFMQLKHKDFNTHRTNQKENLYDKLMSKTIRDIYTAKTIYEQFNTIITKRNTNSLTSAKI